MNKHVKKSGNVRLYIPYRPLPNSKCLGESFVVTILIIFIIMLLFAAMLAHSIKNEHDEFRHNYSRVEADIPALFAGWKESLMVDGSVIQFSGDESVYILSVRAPLICKFDCSGSYEVFAQSKKSGNFFSVKLCFDGKKLSFCSKPVIVNPTNLALILAENNRKELIKELGLKVKVSNF